MRSSLLAACMVVGCSTDTFAPADGAVLDGSDAALSDDGTGSEGGEPCTNVTPVCPTNGLCTSFDAQSSPFAPFQSIAQSPSTIDVVTDVRVSCPASMLATLEAGGGGRAAIYASASSSNIPPPHAVIELDIRLPVKVAGPVSFFGLSTNVSKSGVALGYDSGTWYLFVEANNNIQIAAPRLGVWNHMKLDVTFSNVQGVGQAVLRYDTTTGNQQSVTYPDRTLPGGAPQITTMSSEVGIDAGSGTVSETMAAYYDNVVFLPL